MASCGLHSISQHEGTDCHGLSCRANWEWSNGRSIELPSKPHQRAAVGQASRNVRAVNGRSVPCEDGGQYRNRPACSRDYSRLDRDPAYHYFYKHVGDFHLCCRIDGLRLCFGQQRRAPFRWLSPTTFPRTLSRPLLVPLSLALPVDTDFFIAAVSRRYACAGRCFVN